MLLLPYCFYFYPFRLFLIPYPCYYSYRVVSYSYRILATPTMSVLLRTHPCYSYHICATPTASVLLLPYRCHSYSTCAAPTASLLLQTTYLLLLTCPCQIYRILATPNDTLASPPDLLLRTHPCHPHDSASLLPGTFTVYIVLLQAYHSHSEGILTTVLLPRCCIHTRYMYAGNHVPNHKG